MERDICTICVQAIVEDVGRAIGKLACKHVFHLSCIGSEFNVKGEMRCPNCRAVEHREWLFAQPQQQQQQQQQREDEEEEEAEAIIAEEEEEEAEAEAEEVKVEEEEEQETEVGEEEPEEENVSQMLWRNLQNHYLQQQLNVLQRLLDENDLFWFQDSNDLRVAVDSIFSTVERPEEHYHILLQPGGDYWCPSTDFILQLTPPQARRERRASYDHPADSGMTRSRPQLNGFGRERRARGRWPPYRPAGNSMTSTRPRPQLNSSRSSRASLDSPYRNSPFLVPPLRPYVRAVLQCQTRGSCRFHTRG